MYTLVMSIYSMNEEYFEEINTPEKAYILGFIYGDGCITNQKRTLAISVKDRDVLEFIRDELNYAGPIHRYRDGKIYALRISRKKVVEDLMKLGLGPRKSKILTFPDFLSKDFHLPFVFGLFDADGYVYIPNKDSTWKTSRKIGFSGTEDIITGIKQVLEPKGFSKTQFKFENCGTVTTHFVCRHVELFYTLYKDSPYTLKRKLQKFKDNEIVYARLKR
jgi:hypothetical protein